MPNRSYSINLFCILELKHTGYMEVEAIEGKEGSLACNTSRWEEEPVLILWYRGESGIPIYTVDARNGSSLKQAQQIPSGEFEGRAYFDPLLHPPTLRLKTVFREDEEQYRCRCDYRRARTQNFLLKMTVVGKFLQFRLISSRHSSYIISQLIVSLHWNVRPFSYNVLFLSHFINVNINYSLASVWFPTINWSFCSSHWHGWWRWQPHNDWIVADVLLDIITDVCLTTNNMTWCCNMTTCFYFLVMMM